MRYLIIVLTFFVALGCGPKEKTTGGTVGTQVGPATQPVSYPPVPQELLQQISSRGDQIDIVFYKYPISVNREGNPDVNEELGRISNQTPQAAPNCQADGRIFYNGNGEMIAEADLYVSPDCYYVVFYQDGKPAYANALTAEAIKFYDNLVQQFRQ